jgi:hypothetical protein
MHYCSQLLAFGLTCLSLTSALDLDTFSGQANALSRQREMAMGQYQIKAEIQPMRMGVQANADDDDELSCSKKQGCKKGCCGPLYVENSFCNYLD